MGMLQISVTWAIGPEERHAIYYALSSVMEKEKRSQ